MQDTAVNTIKAGINSCMKSIIKSSLQMHKSKHKLLHVNINSNQSRIKILTLNSMQRLFIIIKKKGIELEN